MLPPENSDDIGKSPFLIDNASFKWWIFHQVMLVFLGVTLQMVVVDYVILFWPLAWGRQKETDFSMFLFAAGDQETNESTSVFGRTQRCSCECEHLLRFPRPSEHCEHCLEMVNREPLKSIRHFTGVSLASSQSDPAKIWKNLRGPTYLPPPIPPGIPPFLKGNKAPS